MGWAKWGSGISDLSKVGVYRHCKPRFWFPSGQWWWGFDATLRPSFCPVDWLSWVKLRQLINGYFWFPYQVVGGIEFPQFCRKKPLIYHWPYIAFWGGGYCIWGLICYQAHLWWDTRNNHIELMTSHLGSWVVSTLRSRRVGRFLIRGGVLSRLRRPHEHPDVQQAWDLNRNQLFTVYFCWWKKSCTTSDT